jgi:hypothetical protein
VGSAPFPLFARVILAPICRRAYSWPAGPARLSCLNRKIKNNGIALHRQIIQARAFAADGAPRHRQCKITDNRSQLFEIACVLMRFDHVASFIVNVNHSIVLDFIRLPASGFTICLRVRVRESHLGDSQHRQSVYKRNRRFNYDAAR